MPMPDVIMTIHPKNGQIGYAHLRLRGSTRPVEVDCFQHGGILPYVLRELLA